MGAHQEQPDVTLTQPDVDMQNIDINARAEEEDGEEDHAPQDEGEHKEEEYILVDDNQQPEQESTQDAEDMKIEDDEPTEEAEAKEEEHMTTMEEEPTEEEPSKKEEAPKTEAEEQAAEEQQARDNLARIQALFDSTSKAQHHIHERYPNRLRLLRGKFAVNVWRKNWPALLPLAKECAIAGYDCGVASEAVFRTLCAFDDINSAGDDTVRKARKEAVQALQDIIAQADHTRQKALALADVIQGRHASSPAATAAAEAAAKCASAAEAAAEAAQAACKLAEEDAREANAAQEKKQVAPAKKRRQGTPQKQQVKRAQKQPVRQRHSPEEQLLAALFGLNTKTEPSTDDDDNTEKDEKQQKQPEQPSAPTRKAVTATTYRPLTRFSSSARGQEVGLDLTGVLVKSINIELDQPSRTVRVTGSRALEKDHFSEAFTVPQSLDLSKATRHIDAEGWLRLSFPVYERQQLTAPFGARSVFNAWEGEEDCSSCHPHNGHCNGHCNGHRSAPYQNSFFAPHCHQPRHHYQEPYHHYRQPSACRAPHFHSHPQQHHHHHHSLFNNMFMGL